VLVPVVLELELELLLQPAAAMAMTAASTSVLRPFAFSLISPPLRWRVLIWR
jgi:hypothetical protein